MKTTFRISATCAAIAITGCTPTADSQIDGNISGRQSVNRDSAPDAAPVVASKPQLQRGNSIADYLSRRKRQKAAAAPPVGPRWSFSPRRALQPLGTVALFYAVPPTDTGANDLQYWKETRPRHFGLTVWRIQRPVARAERRADMRVSCMRLVDDPNRPNPKHPTTWPHLSQGVRYSHKDKIQDTRVVRVCGQRVRLTNYRPHFQCLDPPLNYWIASFTTGGWAVYLSSGYHDGESSEAAALDLIFAADRVTNALRSAAVGGKRPKPASMRIETHTWGNQKATCPFALGNSPSKEICVNVWSRVSNKDSGTGYLGYATRIVKVHSDAVTHDEVTTSTPWSTPFHGRRKYIGFQFDWCDELGIGGSTMHELKHSVKATGGESTTESRR